MVDTALNILEFSSMSEHVHELTKNIVSKILDNQKYTPGKANEWIESIGSSSLAKLRELSSNFKYLVNVGIFQKVGAGLHLETCAYWDNKTDGSITVRYENESIICICSVLAVAI